MAEPDLPADPRDCRRLAEDTDQPDRDRLIWAVLAVAGELHELRRLLRKR